MNNSLSNINNEKDDNRDDMKPTLIKFLDKLKNQLVNNKMEEKDEEIVGKFFMEYNCRDKIFNGNIMTEGATKDEMIKYLFLGYYIYNYILNKE